MTNETKTIAAELLGAEIADTIEIKDVHFRATYNYWNEYDNAEICSNIVISAKKEDLSFYIVFYYGIGRKQNETESRIWLISEQERESISMEAMLSPAMYHHNQTLSEELDSIRYELDKRFFSDDEGIQNDDPLFIEDYAGMLENAAFIKINMKINKQNPTKADVEKLQGKLEEVKELLDEKIAENNLNVVLNSPLTPLFAKSFLHDNKITAIRRNQVVESPDYTPVKGNVIELISEDKDFEPIVYEIDDGFMNLYGEGICSYEDFSAIENIDINEAEAIFDLFDESFNRDGEFQVRKITMQQLKKDENVLKNIYSTCSEVCEGEFADYLYDNMDEMFAQPHNIALITKAIQDFRSWGAAEDDEEVFAEISYVQDVTVTDINWDSGKKKLPNSLDISVPMRIFENEDPKDYDQIASDYIGNLISDRYGFLHEGFSDTFDKNMHFINEFHDYMYADGKLVEAGVRIGIEKDKNLLLDKGIFYAHLPRNIFLSKEKTEECSNCKKSIAPEDEAYTNFSNGKTLCDSCSVMCESCGNYFHEDGGNRDGENIFCCYGCLQNNQDTLRLIQLKDDEGEILLASTSLTSDEIIKAVFDESDNTMDYEEKLNAYAKANSKVFKRVYAELEII
ncbi:hypothetical protein [Sulfurimonas indica]|uniref:hypothetical protein n=1 Tax=Sulfurimonas TaxID=202746 RepID=UPI0012651C81|nr:hypothetical protein [Sulfurimonas indica]